MIEEPPLLRIRQARNRPTEAQIAAFRGVPTSFVVDAMFGRGALSRQIAPLGFGRDLDCVAAGPALTVENAPADILATLAALAYLQPGDILVATVGGFGAAAAAGDRAVGMMRNAGAAGFVTDGPMRDYVGLIEVGLPCWCDGLTPASPFATGPGRVGSPIAIGGQRIGSGDMIVADRDGVVAVPFDEIDAVIAAIDKVRAAEEALDAEVSEGLKLPPAIAEFLESDRVAFD